MQTKDRIVNYQLFPVVHLVISVLLLLLPMPSLAGGSESDQKQVFPQQILFNHDYYEIEDPSIAAAKMRADARERGIEVDELPVSQSDYKFFDKESGWVRIALPNDAFAFDTSDQSLKLAFKNNEVEKTVIFVTTRFLSIDEVATLMEGGVRIYKRLYAYSPRMAFLVKVSSDSFALLKSQPYFFFATEYGSEFKLGKRCSEGKAGHYNFKYLGELKSHFREDLEKLGFGDITIFAGIKVIGVNGRSDQLPKAASQWWVEMVYRNQVEVSDY